MPADPRPIAARAGDRAVPPFPPDQPRIVDLREPGPFEEAHLPGSCRLALAEIEIPYLRPPRHRPLVLVGESREQAERAARSLGDLGHAVWIAERMIAEWPGPWEHGPESSPVWEPSPLAAEWAPCLAGLSVVDLGCGSGRDAVYFAMRGARVAAVDRLADALEQAGRLAARHGVEVSARIGDLDRDADCWDGLWDAIHIHRFCARPSLALAPDRLAEGGLILCSTYLSQQARIGRKPRCDAHLLRPGELLSAARGLSVLRYHEGEDARGNWFATIVARKGDPHGA